MKNKYFGGSGVSLEQVLKRRGKKERFGTKLESMLEVIFKSFRSFFDFLLLKFDLDKIKFEKILRKNHIYDLLIPIKYNSNKIIKNKGSAIFIH